jgi:hypothetical protein
VNFELIEPVDNALLPVLIERYRKLQEEIDFPYVPFTEEEAPTQGRSAGADKKLTKPRAKR